MKKLIMLFFLFSFLSNANFAQTMSEKEKKIDSLFTLVKKITPAKRNEIFDSKLLRNKKVFINEKNLEKAKELMYYSYAHAPLELRKKEKALFKKWEKTDYTELKPNERKKIIEKAIEEKYGKDYLAFLKTPYFIRVQILKTTKKTNSLPGKMRGKISRINLTAKIVTVLKGENYYSINDTTTVTFMPIWFYNSDVLPPKFKIGEEYIIPLNNWKNYSSNILELDMHGLNTLYQIRNSEVYNPLISETKIINSWIDFKNEFKQKYLMNK